MSASLNRALTSTTRAFAAAALTVLLGSTACSSKTPATPQAFLTSSIQPGANGAMCLQNNSEWVDVGSHSVDNSGNDDYTLIQDGKADVDGTTVSVSCSVTADGDGFAVNASASKATGTEAGTVTISGHFTASGTQTAIMGLFQKNVGTYQESDCTVTYSSSVMGVAAGRVWGLIECPTATFASQSQTCEASGEFRFENCSQ